MSSSSSRAPRLGIPALRTAPTNAIEAETGELLDGPIRHICWPQRRWTGPPEALLGRPADVPMAGRCETLDRSLARLFDLLGLDEPLRLPEDDVAAHRNPLGVDRHLPKTAREALRRW